MVSCSCSACLRSGFSSRTRWWAAVSRGCSSSLQLGFSWRIPLWASVLRSCSSYLQLGFSWRIRLWASVSCRCSSCLQLGFSRRIHLWASVLRCCSLIALSGFSWRIRWWVSVSRSCSCSLVSGLSTRSCCLVAVLRSCSSWHPTGSSLWVLFLFLAWRTQCAAVEHLNFGIFKGVTWKIQICYHGSVTSIARVLLGMKNCQKKVFKKCLCCHAQDLNSHHLWFKSQLHYQLSQTLRSLMAVLAYTSAFCALVWMSNHTCRLLKVNFVILKGTAFISSKYRFNPC